MEDNQTVQENMEILKKITSETPPSVVQSLITSTLSARRKSMHHGEDATLLPEDMIEKWPHLSMVKWVSI